MQRCGSDRRASADSCPAPARADLTDAGVTVTEPGRAGHRLRRERLTESREPRDFIARSGNLR